MIPTSFAVLAMIGAFFVGYVLGRGMGTKQKKEDEDGC